MTAKDLITLKLIFLSNYVDNKSQMLAKSQLTLWRGRIDWHDRQVDKNFT